MLPETKMLERRLRAVWSAQVRMRVINVIGFWKTDQIVTLGLYIPFYWPS